MSGACIRIHGDFHLGQMLSTGKDFLIVDFEGEPARSIHERRGKRSALRDVAGMLRSFHYAAHTALRRRVAQGAPHARQLAAYEKWSQAWQRWIGHVFLQAYLAQAASLPFVPQSHALVARLLEAELLDKAIYELGYELNTRPDWVEVPLQAVWQLMQPLP